MNNKQFEVRDMRHKEKFFLDDRYLNGYAKVCGVYATAVYLSLCRHADKEQKCWPSHEKIAEEHAISSRQVIRALKILADKNIVRQERVGKKANNRYWLVDKSEWTVSQVTTDSDVTNSQFTGDCQSVHHVTISQFHSKDTHIKETHSKDITKVIEKPSYGNEDINELVKFLETEIGGSLDGTQKENRQYCHLLLGRFKKDYPTRDSKELIQALIRGALVDSFHSKNIAGFKYLYYNAQKIIMSLKNKKQNIIKIS